MRRWIPRILLAMVFVFAGAKKFDPDSLYVRIFDQIGWGTWFRYFTGVVEIGGGLLLLVPRAAAAGFVLLACAIIGAAAFWTLSGSLRAMTLPVILLVAIVASGWPDLRRVMATLRRRLAAPSRADV